MPDLRLGFPISLHARPPDYNPPRGPRPAPAQAGEPEPARQAAPPRQPRPAPGPNERFLAELKVMGAGPSRYPRGQANSRDKQVDRRARGLPANYRGKLRAIDQQYYRTAEGEVGPCQARLESLGDMLQIVVGAFGEASSDLDRAIRGIAESRVLYLLRQEGRPVTDAWTGQVLGQHRRFFSALFVRCQAACLVSRMGHLGEGAKEAAARRKVWTAQEMRSRKEAEAFHSAYIRGRGMALARPGH